MESKRELEVKESEDSINSYILKLENPESFCGKLPMKIFEKLYPKVKILILSGDKWLRVSGEQILHPKTISGQTLLIKEKDNHFDVCNENGLIVERIKNDNDSLFSAIIQSAENNKVKFDSRITKSSELRAVIANELEENKLEYLPEIKKLIEELYHAENERPKNEAFSFMLDDESGILIPSATLLLSLTDYLEEDLNSNEKLDFQKFLNSFNEVSLISFRDLKERLSKYISSFTLQSKIQNSKPFLFYQNVSELQKIVREVADSSKWRKKMKGKYVALFLGNSSAGKSSTINRFLDIPFEIINKGDEEDPLLVLEFGENENGAKVDNKDPVSCTKAPQIFKSINQEDFVYCDSAGFGETGEGFIAVLNATLLSSIVKNSKGACCVLVLDVTKFYDRVDLRDYHTLITALLGKNYYDYRENFLVLLNKGSRLRMEKFEKDLKRIIDNELVINDKTREIAPFIYERIHRSFLYDKKGVINNVQTTREKTHQLLKITTITPALVADELKCVDKFYEALREQIQMSFSRFTNPTKKTLEKECTSLGEFKNKFELLRDLQNFANEVSKIVNEQNVTFVDFLKVILKLIGQDEENKNIQLETHVPEMIKFLDILDPLVSQDVREKSSDFMTTLQTNLSKELHGLAELYMTDIYQFIADKAANYYTECDKILVSLDNDEDSENHAENTRVIKYVRKKMNSMYKRIKDEDLFFLSEVAQTFNNETIYTQADGRVENTFNLLRDLIANYEDPQFSHDSMKKLRQQAADREKDFVNQTTNFIQAKKSRWIITKIINTFKFISCAFLKDLIANYGEKAVATTIYQKLGEETILKYIPFAGAAIGYVQCAQNIRSGSYSVALLNFASGTMSAFGFSLFAFAADVTAILVDVSKSLQKIEIEKKEHFSKALQQDIHRLKFMQHEWEKEKLRQSLGQKKRLVRYKKHVLAIDGGGILGVVAARILLEIQIRLKAHYLHEYFDLIAGTSAGSLIAAAISIKKREQNEPFGAADVIDIFQKKKSLIFKKARIGLNTSKYSNEGLIEVLKENFGETKLGDTLVPLLIVTAREYESNKYETFDFFYDNDSKDGISCLLREAVLLSSSAPTYFPEEEFEIKNQGKCKFCDGGIVASNPSCRGFHHLVRKHQKDKLTAKDFIVVSIGTGDYPASQIGNFNKDGKLYWGLNGVRRQVDHCNIDAHNTMVNQFKELPSQYFRLQPKFTEIFEMDDASDENMIKLLKCTEEYLNQEDTQILLDNLVKRLQESD